MTNKSPILKDKNKPHLIQQQSAFYHGPIPPPEILQRFELIQPGFADRILKMAETQAAHRQHLEKSVIESDISLAHKGSLFGFLIGLAGMVTAAYFAHLGHPGYATLFGGTTLGGLISIFVYGKKMQKQQLEQKQAEAVVPSKINQ